MVPLCFRGSEFPLRLAIRPLIPPRSLPPHPYTPSFPSPLHSYDGKKLQRLGDLPPALQKLWGICVVPGQGEGMSTANTSPTDAAGAPQTASAAIASAATASPTQPAVASKRQAPEGALSAAARSLKRDWAMAHPRVRSLRSAVGTFGAPGRV